ncbi:Transferase protein [Dioscorea alata]|uniref:Transferase protein n=1 Tax=Dioscorea alata TaxID=55571 RepID=A0ACB7V866_DIOAL|nr:Transferase protein [Dioscorea alata]
MASSSSPQALKVLNQCSISPPKGSVPETSIPLSFLDLLWLQAGAVERLFFYKFSHSTSHFIDHFLPTLKASLSLTLQHLFLLASRVRSIPDSEHKFDYHFTEDKGSVPFILAESEADFDTLSGDQDREFKHLQPLIPSLVSPSGDHSHPLMALQVTVFPNHGLCLAITINHVVCDGASSINFIKSWAATCSSAATTPIIAAPPFYDRTELHDSKLHSLFLRTLVEDGALIVIENSSTTVDEVIFSTFSLKTEHVDKLKKFVLDKNEEYHQPFHCSTFVIVCAYVWTCLVKSTGWPHDKTAYMCFMADARGRLRPALPPGYFGNCLGGCMLQMKVAELVNYDGVRKAAEVIGSKAENWPELIRELAMEEKVLSVAGSPKFRVYDTDFGWGKPVKVEITSIRNSLSMAMTESRGNTGGVEIGFAMPKVEMGQFRAHFIGGLELL